MYEFQLGTIALIVILCVSILLVRRKFFVEIGAKIDRLLVLTIILRLIWMFVVIFSEHKMTFFVYDDESYYRMAMGENFSDTSNLYTYFLRWLYDVFGQSSLNGRLVNMAFSIMTIYPLAFLEKEMSNDCHYRATKFMALSPFQIFISFFEIKDIILMFTFTTSYAIIKSFSKKISVSNIAELILLCVISEQIRSGMGAIPILLLFIDKTKNGIGTTKIQRFFSKVVGLGMCIPIIIFYFQDYILDQSMKIEQYQTWIFTQFSSLSIYNQFVITQIQDIWKLPFCFILYAMQPLNALDGSSRFFREWGMFAKIIDVPVLLMALRWLVEYIKKEKIYSLMFIIPYAFVSGINLTNARQGFFLYPIMYLICFWGYERSETYDGNSSLIRIINSKIFACILWMSLYIVWILFVIIRL